MSEIERALRRNNTGYLLTQAETERPDGSSLHLVRHFFGGWSAWYEVGPPPTGGFVGAGQGTRLSMVQADSLREVLIKLLVARSG